MEPLRNLVVALGKELAARGLAHQADSMRVYLLALDRGLLDDRRRLHVDVSPALIHDMLGTLQVPPHEAMFPVVGSDVTGCPKCGKHSTFVEVSILDRARHCCSGCKHRWLTIHTP